MQIRENISLRQYNTFGIDVRARYFSAFAGIDTLAAWMEKNPKVKRDTWGGQQYSFYQKCGWNRIEKRDRGY